MGEMGEGASPMHECVGREVKDMGPFWASSE